MKKLTDALRPPDFLLVLSLALGAGVFVYSFFVRDPQFRLVLRFMALLVFVSQPHQYLCELEQFRFKS